MKTFPNRYLKRIRRWPLTLTFVTLQACSVQNQTSANHQPIPLWPNGAPGSEDWHQVEDQLYLYDQLLVRNITQPTLIPYLAAPENNTGLAVIIAPGGGYLFLCLDQEGTFVAEWLNRQGINAFVLKYRLTETAASRWGFTWQTLKLFFGAARNKKNIEAIDYPESDFVPVQQLAIDDGLKAISLVRDRAAEWNIRPDAVGIMGFSAGGGVANGTVIRGTSENRPDFIASIYGLPVVGDIPENAPPLFQVAADDDPLVPIQWIQTLHNRWQATGSSSTLIRYEEAGHGYGMRTRDKPSDEWINEFYKWLKDPAHPFLETQNSRDDSTNPKGDQVY